ncbi:hypothetical protein [Pontixanthobacter sp.]|uniref:hypothetical protein n=1 Tax=Pontixanthobacter sp. TaxID=2792078 RepID=UPI003C7D16CA
MLTTLALLAASLSPAENALERSFERCLATRWRAAKASRASDAHSQTEQILDRCYSEAINNRGTVSEDRVIFVIAPAMQRFASQVRASR